MSKTVRLILVALLLPAFAPAAQVHVPDQLKDWEQWVLKDKEYLACPFYFNRAAADESDFVCEAILSAPGPVFSSSTLK